VVLGIPERSRRSASRFRLTTSPRRTAGPPATLGPIPAVSLLLREFPPARGPELAGAGGRLTVVLTVAL